MSEVKRPSWFKIYSKDREMFCATAAEDLKAALVAALDFLESGEERRPDYPASVLYAHFKKSVDEACKEYQQQCDKTAKARKAQASRISKACDSMSQPVTACDTTEDRRKKKEDRRLLSSFSDEKEEKSGASGNAFNGHSAAPQEAGEIMIVDGEVFDLVFDPELGRKRRVRRRKDDD